MKIVHNDKLKIVTFLDERFYTHDQKNYYPSATTILDLYPKGSGFIQYLKTVGVAADEYLKRAGEQGTKIHRAIDSLLSGNEVKWLSDAGEGLYTVEEWIMINRFIDFQTRFKPEIIAHEISLLDEESGYGGTIDLVCRIKNEIFLIDYKSSNAVYKTHCLQIASYSALWDKQNPQLPISRRGILHLKALTRTAPDGKIQGEGWKLDEPADSQTHLYNIFENIKTIWYEENKNAKPKNLQYPDALKL